MCASVRQRAPHSYVARERQHEYVTGRWVHGGSTARVDGRQTGYVAGASRGGTKRASVEVERRAGDGVYDHSTAVR